VFNETHLLYEHIESKSGEVKDFFYIIKNNNENSVLFIILVNN
jgi:hypothetical protein